MIVIITALLLAVFVMFFLWKHHQVQVQVQVGGYYDNDEDPYRNIRFWKVIDFLRGFWFTR